MDNTTLFAYANTIGQRAGLVSIENQVDQKSIDIARSQTIDLSDLATAMVLVARGYSNTLFTSKADCRCFATLAGRLLYKHRHGDKPTTEDVDDECQTHLYHLMVPGDIRKKAYKWVNNMLFSPLEVN